jgi:hypothetical protein
MTASKPRAATSAERAGAKPMEKDKLAEKLAAERIHRALQKIERAQNMLNEAAAELCPIVGMVRQWNQLSKLGEDCKARWYALRGEILKKSFQVDATCLEAHLQAVSRPAHRSPEQADG